MLRAVCGSAQCALVVAVVGMLLFFHPARSSFWCSEGGAEGVWWWCHMSAYAGGAIMRRFVVLCLVVFVQVLLVVTPAAAHAVLVRSEPPAGATLARAPEVVVLEFSEDVDARFSRIQLFNSRRAAMPEGMGVVNPSAPRVLRLALSSLPKDSYTAVWRVRSAADGHITEGILPFGVGVAASAGSLVPALGAIDPATEPLDPLTVVVRWFNLVVLTLMLGGVPFGLLVWRPLVCAAPSTPAVIGFDDALTRVIRRLLVGSGGLFLLTSVVFLLTQAAAAADVPVSQTFGLPVMQVLAGRSGQLWFVRVALVIAIGVVGWRLPSVSQRSVGRWWGTLALGALVGLTFSLTSHSGAVPQGVAVAVALDWVHIAAMVTWLGGLVPLLWVIARLRSASEQVVPLAGLVGRFSLVAAICVGVLVFSGFASSLMQIGRLDLLPTTTYGRALLVKLGLFGVVLGFAGLNLVVFSPRLRTATDRLIRMFRCSVWAEVCIGAFVLMAVAGMTSVAPSKVAWEAHERQGVVERVVVADVELVLRIAPARIGDNEFAVDVTDHRPGASSAMTRMLLRFDMLGMDMGPLQTEAQLVAGQRYTTRGNFVSMAGRWHVEVVLRRAGFDDVRHMFDVDIVRPPDQ